MGEQELVQPRGVVVIGGSAGGLEALIELVAGLPTDLPAVTIHIGEQRHSRLPRILSRSGALEAVHAVDGAPLDVTKIYVAPPGWHLLMTRGRVALSDSPRINLWVPNRSSMSCNLGIFVDQSTEPVAASEAKVRW